MSNRKLIRPSLAEIKEQLTVRQPRAKRPAPNDQTDADNFYYVKQMQNKTPMVVVLQDGETIKGSIEWYDKNSIKLNRSPEPNPLPNRTAFLSKTSRSVKRIQRADPNTEGIDFKTTSRPMPAGSPAVIPIVARMRKDVNRLPCPRFPCTCT